MTVRLVTCIVSTTLILFAGEIWVETTQHDFADGAHESNLYASHYDGGRVEFVPSYDLNNDGYVDIFTGGGSHVELYWGSESGYSYDNTTLFPAINPRYCDAADLNGDGYADLMFVQREGQKVSIYWGTSNGPDPGSSFHITTNGFADGIFAADFNKDGYLDITSAQGMIPYHAAIFWGSATGFDPNQRIDLYHEWGACNIEVADFDHNGWLDVLYITYRQSWQPGEIRIYWNGSSGFSPTNYMLLTSPPGSQGASTADLNKDGHLDIISTAWDDDRSYIFWGSETGYSQANMKILCPLNTYGGSAVGYMNDDDYLDIIFFHGGDGPMQSKIYWGSANGYSDSRFSFFGPAAELTTGTVFDFNADGYLDVFCGTWSAYPNSYIYWGPSLTTFTTLYEGGFDRAMHREYGDIYHRHSHEEYVSSVFGANACVDWGIIEWDAEEPSGAEVQLWVRTGNTPTPNGSWSDWHIMDNGSMIPEILNAQYLQYKARFCFTNPCYLPNLEEVRVTYNCEQVIAAGVEIKPEVINLRSHGRFSAFIKLQANYYPAHIDLSTVQCEGAYAIAGKTTPLRYIAQFNVQDLIGVEPGEAVEFKVSGKLTDGTSFFGVDTVRVISGDYTMLNCTPNPISTITNITVPISNNIIPPVRIYNINGALVRDLTTTEIHNGLLRTTWNCTDNIGRRVPAGVYWIRIGTNTSFISKKVIVLD